MPPPEAPCLAFLDPFGYSQTPMRNVEQFIGQDREVSITFMSSYVRRFLKLNPEPIADLFGIDIPDDMVSQEAFEIIQHGVIENNIMSDAIDNAVCNYADALKKGLIQISF